MKDGNGRGAAHLAGLPVFLRAPRAAGLWLAGVLITLASVVAFGLSYRGLLEWALHHQWPLGVAVFFPLLIDVLIVVCEVILFVAAVDGGTPWHVRGLAWLVLLVFTGISVAGNAEHAVTATAQDRAGFALPPLVLAVALGFGLGELKRQAAKYRDAPARASAGASARRKLPALREIQARQNCGQETARKVRAELAAFERSRDGAVTPAVAVVPAGERPPSPAGALNGHQQPAGRG